MLGARLAGKFDLAVYCSHLISCRVCGEMELNIALIELVKALGHPHMVVHGAAYHEVLI